MAMGVGRFACAIEAARLKSLEEPERLMTADSLLPKLDAECIAPTKELCLFRYIRVNGELGAAEALGCKCGFL
jgi:hypothetical protein